MSLAPLPLAGSFHEFSVAVHDVRSAVDFYERLGFSQATTTDTFAHPYGVLTDARLFIGLHQRAGASVIDGVPSQPDRIGCVRQAGARNQCLRGNTALD